MHISWDDTRGSSTKTRCRRRDYFRAQRLLSNARSLEKGILSELLSYSEGDVTCRTTTLHEAIEAGSTEGVGQALVSDRGSGSVYNLEGDGAMHLAAQQMTGAVGIMMMLKGAGVDVHQRDGDDATPLMRAALVGNVEAVEWLLKQDAKGHNLRASSGATALHFAMQSDATLSVDTVKMLVEAGADPSTPNKVGRTPLHDMAFCRGYYSLCKSKVEVLVAAGAAIDARNRRGNTPLMAAVQQSNSGGAVRALVDSGASLSLKDRLGWTILHYAALYCDHDTLSDLCRHKTLCNQDVDPFHKNSPWGSFIYRLSLPPLFSPTTATEAACRAFEALYVQVRDFHLRTLVVALQRVAALLSHNATDEALSQSWTLAEQREPRILFQTDAREQPLRSIYLHIRQGDLADALDAIQEQIDVWEDEVRTSPWVLESRWWHVRPAVEGPSVEEWQRQFAFAQRMREEGLQRWRQGITQRNVARGGDQSAQNETTEVEDSVQVNEVAE